MSIETQNKEFDAVNELSKQWRRIQLTPPVDDDYPAVRFEYEQAVRAVMEAFEENGRDRGASPRADGMSPQASNLRSLSERLLDAQIASCSCLTKTPEHQHHDPMCRYRLFYEAWRALDAQRQAVTLNGFQARMVLKFIDGDDECSIEVAELPDRTADNGDRLEAGLYVWLTEYPEEGCLLLTEKPTAEGFCAEPKQDETPALQVFMYCPGAGLLRCEHRDCIDYGCRLVRDGSCSGRKLDADSLVKAQELNAELRRAVKTSRDETRSPT